MADDLNAPAQKVTQAGDCIKALVFIPPKVTVAQQQGQAAQQQQGQEQPGPSQQGQAKVATKE
jgi:hypothetical protein